MIDPKNDLALRRHYGAIRTCLDRGRRLGHAQYYAKAAGHLLKVCEATGETYRVVSRRLKLDPMSTRLMMRDGSRPARQLPHINREPLGCVRGAACTCTQTTMHPRCGNWRRGDPQRFDIGGPDALDIALAVVDEWRGWRPGDPTSEPDQTQKDT